MKYSTVLVAIFATAVAAGAIEQRGDKDKPPKCAKKCIKEHYKVSGCDKKDMKCMCSSEPFHKAVVPCIKDRCGKGELEDMAFWVQRTCGFSIEGKKGGKQ